MKGSYHYNSNLKVIYLEKVKLRLKLLVSYLENGDVKKARENYLQIAEDLGETEFKKGYAKAINGIVTSSQKNKIKNKYLQDSLKGI